MTLKEKFEDIDVTFSDQTSYLKYDECNQAVSRCEQISDEYAIAFAKWYSARNALRNLIDYNLSAKEMLEIFKEEQKWK